MAWKHLWAGEIAANTVIPKGGRLMMRHLLLAVLLIGSAPASAAVHPGATSEPKPPGVIYEGGGRTGGDTFADAVAIYGLPYGDSGSTCGYVNNYDETCPYNGSTSPDVVYSYTPAAHGAISVDLCSSQYDTKVYIYAGGVGNLIACNDDAGCGYSGYQSELPDVALLAGVTYYIVVDGYGGACGTYVLDVGFGPIGCPAWYCPPGALLEGEPECHDDYDDTYNGGCNSTGWTEVWAQTGGCSTLCGKSGTYNYQGQSYRDTDWFAVVGAGGTTVMECCAMFPLQILFIWGLDCDNPQYHYALASPLEEAILSHDLAAGQEAWLWVGPSVFNGVPCSSQYIMDVCGIEGEPPVPTKPGSWGSIKAAFRREHRTVPATGRRHAVLRSP